MASIVALGVSFLFGVILIFYHLKKVARLARFVEALAFLNRLSNTIQALQLVGKNSCSKEKSESMKTIDEIWK